MRSGRSRIDGGSGRRTYEIETNREGNGTILSPSSRFFEKRIASVRLAMPEALSSAPGAESVGPRDIVNRNLLYLTCVLLILSQNFFARRSLNSDPAEVQIFINVIRLLTAHRSLLQFK